MDRTASRPFPALTCPAQSSLRRLRLPNFLGNLWLRVLLVLLVLPCLIPCAFAQSSNFVQVNSATPQTPQSLVAVTFTQAQTAGNLNVVVVGWNDSTAQVQSLSDSAGNSYSVAVGPTVQSGTATQVIYYAKNIAAAPANSNTVSVTFTQAAIYPDIRIAEYAGVDTVSPLDVDAAAQGGTDISDSGAVTITNSNEMLIGGNLVQGTTLGAGSGYTERITTADGDILEDQALISAGTYHATAILDWTQPWIMQLVAFKRTISNGFVQGNRATPQTPQTSVVLPFTV